MRVLLVLAVLLVAGCTRPFESGTPAAPTPTMTSTAGTPTTPATATVNEGACRDEGAPNEAAPLIRALQEEPDSIAQRLAQAMGTSAQGPPDARDDGSLRWTDGNATVTVMPSEGDMRVVWERAGDWRPSEAEARATIEAVLRTFGVPDDGRIGIVDTNPNGDVNLFAGQSYRGLPILGVAVHLTSGPMASIDVRSLRDVEPDLELMEDARAVEIATRALRCSLDQAGLTEAAGHQIVGAFTSALGARGDSLSRVVQVNVTEPGEPSHCGHVEHVHVDAVSGKQLGILRPPCD